MIALPGSLRNEKGVAFVAFAVFGLATVGLASLGLGTGLLFLVHNESQNASDAGALAGAEALFFQSSANLEARDAVKNNALTGGVESPGAAFATDANILSVTTGNYVSGGSFQAGVPPENAVEVVVEKQLVPLLRAGQTSTVRTRSVAAWSGPSSSTPTLPILVGACEFTTPNCTEDDCLPTINGAGATDPQVRWTSLSSTPTWRNVMRTFPSSCQAYSECAFAAGATEELEIDDTIGVFGSNPTPLLNCARACFTPGGPQLVQVPIVSCQIGSTATVLGFATFLLDPATIVGDQNLPNWGMTLTGRVPPPGETGGGGPFFGTAVITLVE